MTEQQIKNKERYLELIDKLELAGMETALKTYLEGPRADYFNKPATTQYFKCYAGGLCQHALDVYDELTKLCETYAPGKYTEEDIIKVALFKDIYKAELYEEYNRNVKDENTGNWYSKKEYRVKESRPTFGDLGFSSYMVANHFVHFTDEQIEAITHSSLGLDNQYHCRDIYDIVQSYNLVLLTHMADLIAAYLEKPVVEEEVVENETQD